MHNLPPWYFAFNEIEYIFHTVIDVAFIIVGFAIVVLVSRPGWKQHLRWASPAAAASVLTGIDRFVRDLYHYFGIGTLLNYYLTSDLFNYAANVAAFYSTFMLWRTLRDLVRHPTSPDPLAEYPAQPGVWPPAPTLKR